MGVARSAWPTTARAGATPTGPCFEPNFYPGKLASKCGTGDSEKPNGMHWTTCNRLLDQADELDERGWMSALGRLRLSAG
jgi:hypothetical protein